MKLRLIIDAELAAAVGQRGGAAAARTLNQAAARAEQLLAHLLSVLCEPSPSMVELRLVPPGHGATAGVQIDPNHLVGDSAPRMASVLLAIVLNAVADDPSLAVADPPKPKRAHRSRRDQLAYAYGADLTGLAESEVELCYQPYHSFIRSSTNALSDEAADVEGCLLAAMDGIPGAGILDKTMWDWQLRIP